LKGYISIISEWLKGIHAFGVFIIPGGVASEHGLCSILLSSFLMSLNKSYLNAAYKRNQDPETTVMVQKLNNNQYIPTARVFIRLL
jgi:hypothetical protein